MSLAHFGERPGMVPDEHRGRPRSHVVSEPLGEANGARDILVYYCKLQGYLISHKINTLSSDSIISRYMNFSHQHILGWIFFV